MNFITLLAAAFLSAGFTLQSNASDATGNLRILVYFHKCIPHPTRKSHFITKNPDDTFVFSFYALVAGFQQN
jgi:hypothetical protein